jgi:hypothetical protein
MQDIFEPSELITIPTHRSELRRCEIHKNVTPPPELGLSVVIPESKTTPFSKRVYVVGNFKYWQFDDIKCTIYRAAHAGGGYDAYLTLGCATTAFGWSSTASFGGGVGWMIELLNDAHAPLYAWNVDTIEVNCRDNGLRVFRQKSPIDPDLYDLTIDMRLSDTRKR